MTSKLVTHIRTNQKEFTRFLKFSVVGTIGAVVDFGTLYLLHALLGFPIVLSNTCSFTAAVLSNFIWNRYWTYPDSRSKPIRAQLVQFFAVNVVGWGINTGILCSSASPAPRWSETSARPITGHGRRPDLQSGLQPGQGHRYGGCPILELFHQPDLDLLGRGLMRIGIDYTAAARQRAGIGRYTRELIAALLALVGQDGSCPTSTSSSLPPAGCLLPTGSVRWPVCAHSRFQIRNSHPPAQR